MKKYADKQVTRNRVLKWVRLGQIRVNQEVQRELRVAHVEHLLANFDPDQLGTPELSFRNGFYYVMDGQHRIEALKRWLGDEWEDQCVECWVASGLDEKQEAEEFLRLNDKLNVNAFQKFKVAVRAGRPTETDIDKIVRGEGLCVSQQQVPGAIRAVGTLKKVFTRDGEGCLARALRIASGAYGDAGLEAPIIDGFGLLCGRYNGELKDGEASKALAAALGGVNGLVNSAEMLRQKTGNVKSQCVAATAVELINRKRRRNEKLASWWRE